MTTIRDYANDLVTEAIENFQEHVELDLKEGKTWEEIKEDLVDDFITIIEERILG